VIHQKLLSRFLGPIVCVSVLAGAVPAQAQVVPPAFPAAQPQVERTPAFPGTERIGGGNIFKETLRDFKRLPSKDTMTWLSGGAIAAVLAHSFDRSSSSALVGARRLDGMFDPGKTLGGTHVQLAGSLATLAVGKISGSPTVTRVGADLFKAQLISQVLTQAVKKSVNRTRPDGTQYSFPSGHTSTAFATATVLHRDLGWKAGLVGYGVATYIAASRIQEKRHFLSDVAFGAAIGIVAGRTVTMGRGNARFAVAPMATPGGAGVSFDWVGSR
jgi:membrane-associated phospholipid phosphatase